MMELTKQEQKSKDKNLAQQVIKTGLSSGYEESKPCKQAPVSFITYFLGNSIFSV